MDNGKFSGAEPPHWYIMLRAADRLNTSVLELEKPENKRWIFRGLAAVAAENEAEESRRKMNEWRRANKMSPI